MGATLVPFLQHLPKRKAFPALFLMCDESWAMSLADAKRRRRFSLPYFLGVALAMYLMWISFTTLGALVGPIMGDVERFGFDMALPAVFLMLLKGMWKGMRAARPWLVSLVVAVVTYLLVPGAWYVAAGALAGLIAAFRLADRP
jgi:predicted branched-subunit amino acid permease